MADTNDKLELKFDPRTIEHLGIKMYSQLPYALAELVANAYDAGAENVKIKLYDNISSQKRIVVIDDGDGMSYEEVRDNFLVIGRRRRDTDESRENSKGRRITGKKGLGKLALFGIGKTIKIETTKSGEPRKTKFTLDWEKILHEPSGTYYPESTRLEKTDINEKGTIITLSNLSRVTDFDLNATAIRSNWLTKQNTHNISLCVFCFWLIPRVLLSRLSYPTLTFLYYITLCQCHIGDSLCVFGKIQPLSPIVFTI